MIDLEQQLTDHLRRRAAAATPRYDLAGIEERGGERAAVELTRVRRGPRPSLWVAVAAALVLIVLVSALVFLKDEATVDVGPSTGTSEVPSWPAPVRAPSDVVHTLYEGVTDDPYDASEKWADITEAGLSGFAVGAAPPRFDALEPGVVLSYGFVLDTNADGSPDYVAGISSDAPRPGDFRAWVTDLETGATRQVDKPPYGYPVEFGLEGNRVWFTFLNGSPVDLGADTVRSYVWTYATRDGVVIAQDYAPDTGWYAPIPADSLLNPANSIVEEPVLPDPGEQPVDAATAEEQVRLAFTGIFDSSSTREARSRFSERPAVWADANRQLEEGDYAEFVDGMYAVVDEVVFTDATHAAVGYRLNRPGGAIPQPSNFGRAVLVDGQWLVAIETTCELVQTANVQCDMSR